MANLKWPSILDFVSELKRTIEKNQSLHIGLENYLKKNHKDEFSLQLNSYLKQIELSKSTESLLNNMKSSHQAALFYLIKGLEGASIYEQLVDFEKELYEICDLNLQEHIQKLPILLQIPLLFLIFPAIVIILIVPTLSQLSF